MDKSYLLSLAKRARMLEREIRLGIESDHRGTVDSSLTDLANTVREMRLVLERSH